MLSLSNISFASFTPNIKKGLYLEKEHRCVTKPNISGLGLVIIAQRGAPKLYDPEDPIEAIHAPQDLAESSSNVAPLILCYYICTYIYM